ncbi:MAG: hypothetical protein GXO32_04185 [Crenarchaeota archaeon]|nr:hypothetical protein [Thermoproteota archaeon]
MASRVRFVIAAMYVVEGLACLAWIHAAFAGHTPSELLAAVGLSAATALLHLGAVLVESEERLERIVSRASRG